MILLRLVKRADAEIWISKVKSCGTLLMRSVMLVTVNTMIILIPMICMMISKEPGQEGSSKSAKVPHLAHSLEINICEPDSEKSQVPYKTIIIDIPLFSNRIIYTEEYLLSK